MFYRFLCCRQPSLVISKMLSLQRFLLTCTHFNSTIHIYIIYALLAVIFEDNKALGKVQFTRLCVSVAKQGGPWPLATRCVVEHLGCCSRMKLCTDIYSLQGVDKASSSAQPCGKLCFLLTWKMPLNSNSDTCTRLGHLPM